MSVRVFLRIALRWPCRSGRKVAFLEILSSIPVRSMKDNAVGLWWFSWRGCFAACWPGEFSVVGWSIFLLYEFPVIDPPAGPCKEQTSGLCPVDGFKLPPFPSYAAACCTVGGCRCQFLCVCLCGGRGKGYQ